MSWKRFLEYCLYSLADHVHKLNTCLSNRVPKASISSGQLSFQQTEHGCRQYVLEKKSTSATDPSASPAVSLSRLVRMTGDRAKGLT